MSTLTFPEEAAIHTSVRLLEKSDLRVCTAAHGTPASMLCPLPQPSDTDPALIQSFSLSDNEALQHFVGRLPNEDLITSDLAKRLAKGALARAVFLTGSFSLPDLLFESWLFGLGQVVDPSPSRFHLALASNDSMRTVSIRLKPAWDNPFFLLRLVRLCSLNLLLMAINHPQIPFEGDQLESEDIIQLHLDGRFILEPECHPQTTAT